MHLSGSYVLPDRLLDRTVMSADLGTCHLPLRVDQMANSVDETVLERTMDISHERLQRGVWKHHP